MLMKKVTSQMEKPVRRHLLCVLSGNPVRNTPSLWPARCPPRNTVKTLGWALTVLLTTRSSEPLGRAVVVSPKLAHLWEIWEVAVLGAGGCLGRLGRSKSSECRLI